MYYDPNCDYYPQRPYEHQSKAVAQQGSPCTISHASYGNESHDGNSVSPCPHLVNDGAPCVYHRYYQNRCRCGKMHYQQVTTVYGSAVEAPEQQQQLCGGHRRNGLDEESLCPYCKRPAIGYTGARRSIADEPIRPCQPSCLPPPCQYSPYPPPPIQSNTPPCQTPPSQTPPCQSPPCTPPCQTPPCQTPPCQTPPCQTPPACFTPTREIPRELPREFPPCQSTSCQLQTFPKPPCPLPPCQTMPPCSSQSRTVCFSVSTGIQCSPEITVKCTLGVQSSETICPAMKQDVCTSCECDEYDEYEEDSYDSDMYEEEDEFYDDQDDMFDDPYFEDDQFEPEMSEKTVTVKKSILTPRSSTYSQTKHVTRPSMFSVRSARNNRGVSIMSQPDTRASAYSQRASRMSSVRDMPYDTRATGYIPNVQRKSQAYATRASTYSQGRPGAASRMSTYSTRSQQPMSRQSTYSTRASRTAGTSPLSRQSTMSRQNFSTRASTRSAKSRQSYQPIDVESVGSSVASHPLAQISDNISYKSADVVSIKSDPTFFEEATNAGGTTNSTDYKPFPYTLEKSVNSKGEVCWKTNKVCQCQNQKAKDKKCLCGIVDAKSKLPTGERYLCCNCLSKANYKLTPKSCKFSVASAAGCSKASPTITACPKTKVYKEKCMAAPKSSSMLNVKSNGKTSLNSQLDQKNCKGNEKKGSKKGIFSCFKKKSKQNMPEK